MIKIEESTSQIAQVGPQISVEMVDFKKKKKKRERRITQIRTKYPQHVAV